MIRTSVKMWWNKLLFWCLTPTKLTLERRLETLHQGNLPEGVWLYHVAHHALHRCCPLFREATSSGWNLDKARKVIIFIIWEQQIETWDQKRHNLVTLYPLLFHNSKSMSSLYSFSKHRSLLGYRIAELKGSLVKIFCFRSSALERTQNELGELTPNSNLSFLQLLYF